jgi:hypothetical protein
MNGILQTYKTQLVVIIVLIMLLCSIKYPDTNKLILLSPVLIGIAVSNFDDKVLLISIATGVILVMTYLMNDSENTGDIDEVNKDTEEGFTSKKFKKLKEMSIGKTSERFGNIMMERGKGKSKKEKFKSTKNGQSVNDITEEYTKYKASFKPIFKNRSKNTGEAIYKLKLLWKNFKDIF